MVVVCVGSMAGIDRFVFHFHHWSHRKQYAEDKTNRCKLFIVFPPWLVCCYIRANQRRGSVIYRLHYPRFHSRPLDLGIGPNSPFTYICQIMGYGDMKNKIYKLFKKTRTGGPVRYSLCARIISFCCVLFARKQGAAWLYRGYSFCIASIP